VLGYARSSGVAVTHEQALDRLVPAMERLAEAATLLAHVSAEVKFLVDSLDPRVRDEFYRLARKKFEPLVEQLRDLVT
jgi:hypothetical protein